MSVYLPIAQTSVDLITLLGLGFVVGILSGMFGVGGGFIMTPVLFFLGIPPSVAVATQSTQVVGTSTSGALIHFERRTIDYKMGGVLLVGGIIGSTLGIQVFLLLSKLGYIELFVSVIYVILLGLVGFLMLIESFRVLQNKTMIPSRAMHQSWHKWPIRVRFPISKIYISLLPPLLIGVFVGMLAAILGVGGGFILIPAMIYLLGMPTKTVIGTSMFQIIFVAAYTTLMHSTTTHAVDLILALILITGSVPGAKIGARLAFRIPPTKLRLAYAILILSLMSKLLYTLVVTPKEFFVLLPGAV